jgi:hypothetical protein
MCKHLHRETIIPKDEKNLAMTDKLYTNALLSRRESQLTLNKSN